MKRIILLITTAIIAISVVAGCGGSSKDTYTTSSSSQADTIVAYDDNSNSSSYDNSIVDGKHFNITKDEFVEKYNEAYKELNPDYVFNNELLQSSRCSVQTPDDANVLNATKMYVYDQSLYTEKNSRRYAELKVYTDENDNCVCISLVRLRMYLDKDIAVHYAYNVCGAAYIAITGDDDPQSITLATENIQTGNGYEYGFTNDEKYALFTIMVGNEMSKLLN